MRGPPGSFIGREHELAVAVDLCRAAAEGRRRLLLVTGEAGIGKSTFCDHLADRVEREGYRVVWGRCWPDGGAPPLWPWQPILIELLGDDAGLLVDEQRADVMGRDRFRRFGAIAERIITACRSAPTLLLVDDLEHADAGALLLHRFIGRALDGVPLVLAGACRSTKSDDGRLDALARDATTIALRRFDRDDTAAYLQAHGVPAGDDGLAAALWRVSGGQPLLLSRIVAHDGAGPGGVDAAVRAISWSVEALDPPVRQLLAVAAVLGAGASVDEVAALVQRSMVDVVDDLAPAVAAGLVRVTPGGGLAFEHDVVRQAALATLRPSEQIDAHARAAARLAAWTDPARLVRRAHHAQQAALRSAADAAIAVTAGRAAACAMHAGFGYERSAELLATAALCERWPALTDRADVVVEHAEAVRSCGRLADARALFATATTIVESGDDPTLLARAALGFCGIWLNEQRADGDRRRMLRLLERALRELPVQEDALRTRVGLRLAAERSYDGGPLAPVLASLDDARALGDPYTLAECLSVAANALLAPEHTALRLRLADEQLVAADECGDGVLALLAMMWRTIALHQLARPEAETAQAELRDRAEALGCQGILYIVEAMEVMRLVRDGQIDEAEAAASACFARGLEVGDADAFAYHGGHLLSIRWLQSRETELLALMDEVAASPTAAVRPDVAFRAIVAALAARAGDLDRARREVHHLTTEGLGSAPRASTWLTGMVALGEAAVELQDPELARQVHDLLTPFADLPVRPSFAITCMGSVERTLGLTAEVVGDLDGAVAHLEKALVVNAQLGHRPMTAFTRTQLAGVLEARGRAGDGERAAALRARAIADVTAMGLDSTAARWRADATGDVAPPVRDEPPGAVASAAVGGPVTHDAAVLRHEGELWTIAFRAPPFRLRDSVGLHHLAALVDQPHRELHVLELTSGRAVACTAATTAAAAGLRIDDGGGAAVLDDRASASYRRRLHDLTEELDEAERWADDGRAAKARAEIDALTDELTSATGIGGRIRRTSGPAERARVNVTKAVRAAIARIARHDPDLGAHLDRSVRTGMFCSYAPDPASTVVWQR